MGNSPVLHSYRFKELLRHRRAAKAGRKRSPTSLVRISAAGSVGSYVVDVGVVIVEVVVGVRLGVVVGVEAVSVTIETHKQDN